MKVSKSVGSILISRNHTHSNVNNILEDILWHTVKNTTDLYRPGLSHSGVYQAGLKHLTEAIKDSLSQGTR